MLFAQNEACAICKNPETAKHKGVLKKLAVDHCHISLKIRGLLCSNCNQALGKFKENLETLINAINYLKNQGN